MKLKGKPQGKSVPQKPASYTSPQPDETKKRPNPKASHRTDSHCSAAATKGREDAADAATLGNPTALEENGPIYTNHKLLRLNETKQDSPTAIKELNWVVESLEEDTDGFNWRTPATFTGFLLTFCSLFQKLKRKKYFSTHFGRPVLL